MRRISRMELFWAALLGLVLFASALCLVELQYRTRVLFVEHEHEVDLMRRLLDDQAELQMKVRRAALPGEIAEGAAELDLVGATGDTTVTLVEQPSGAMALSEETKARIAAADAAEAERRAKAEEKAAQRAARAARAKKAGAAGQGA